MAGKGELALSVTPLSNDVRRRVGKPRSKAHGPIGQAGKVSYGVLLSIGCHTHLRRLDT